MIDTETLKSSACEFSHHSETSNWGGCGSPHNMRRADAARYIREIYGIPCVATTLAKYACIGNGPVFRKAGKFPLYSRDDLDTWARSRLGEPVQSTSALSVRSRRSRSG
jgi:hypothetical protein